MMKKLFCFICLFVGAASLQPALAMELFPSENEHKPVFALNNNILQTPLPQYVKFNDTNISEEISNAQNFLIEQWSKCKTWGDLKNKILSQVSSQDKYWENTYFIRNCMNAMRHIQFLGKDPLYSGKQLIKVTECDAYQNTLEQYQIGYISYYPDALLFACALGNQALSSKASYFRSNIIENCRDYTSARFNEIHYYGRKKIK
jgi:hypothetical protein